ncbi:hypothetical protein QUF54_02040 [Candidatus Marithioploca araucensis]|uniref:Uncharacterized protein n=1 Tax=Candidatus Marithioploca araucensis TaxID=70273 RepID=A0ABT7VR26_9GAMM|nr:hypothetical protein [Candidatus Marithioploca araucensis]
MVNGEWLMNFNRNINNLLGQRVVYSIKKRYTILVKISIRHANCNLLYKKKAP